MSEQQKPVVHFVGEANFFTSAYPDPQTGQQWTYARVYGLDHPYLGRDIISTSEVLKVNDDGSFETRNTLYVPLTSDEFNRDSRAQGVE